MSLQAEELRQGFTKYRLVEVGEWPWTPYMHRISTPDIHPHDHPGNMTVTVVRGHGYLEEQFVQARSGLLSVARVRRYLGDRFEIQAECIHRIIEIYGDEVWTLVEHEPNRRAWKVYPL